MKTGILAKHWTIEPEHEPLREKKENNIFLLMFVRGFPQAAYCLYPICASELRAHLPAA